MDDRDRGLRLFLQRWEEQLATTFTPRRARTLSPLAAVEEALALAESWVRTGGQTKPSADPDEGGHGVQTLPDVAAEAELAVQHDAVLGRRHPARRDVLVQALKRFRSEKAEDVRTSVGQIQALLPKVRSAYLAEAFSVLHEITGTDSRHHAELVRLSQDVVSELRCRGWTDAGLLEAHPRDTVAPATAVEVLRERTAEPERFFECYVGLTLPRDRPPLPADEPTFQVVEQLPEGTRAGRPLKAGPYARVVVEAFDAYGAAARAQRRVLATIGALTVFLPTSRLDVSSEIVGVCLPDGALRGCELAERLPDERRYAKPDEIRRIFASSWRASASPAADPLHDALRLRHRGLVTTDSESRLLLLWSGIERLTSGARGFRGGALAAAKELVSHAVTFGKLRRDVGDFAGVMEHKASTDERVRTALLGVVGGYADARSRTDRIDRRKVLERLLGDEAYLRTMVSPLHGTEPMLAYRAHALWRDFGAGNAGGRGKAIAEYHERSRQRVAWQVGRIYRARNRVAHLGVGPERTRDLVAHAHFYLTQLIAICVHYGENAAVRAQELLTTRMGQYQAYIELLRRNDPACLEPDALLRPTRALEG
ncbi:MAG: hypothetical protein IT373_35180 [Polyangiaceae bacterium]|nr:hypothetical protein [Polyangiaceae bacterium]